MFTRIANGWELAKESFRVLRMDKELLVFPLVSGIACLLVLASFGLPLWNSSYASVVFEEGRIPNDPVAYAILFAFYFVNYFVMLFFNSGLVACAIIRFKGGDPTLADGFRAATNRLPQILGWAMVSATVGVILRIIESRSERAGQFAAALLGAGWSIATYFVVPVLVAERAGPVAAVKRSLSVLRRTWGEALTANFGIGILVFLAFLPALGFFALSGFLFVSEHAILGGVLIAVGVGWLLLVTLMSSALDSILLAALYLYAADGTVPQHFDNRLLQDAFWVLKKSAAANQPEPPALPSLFYTSRRSRPRTPLTQPSQRSTGRDEATEVAEDTEHRHGDRTASHLRSVDDFSLCPRLSLWLSFDTTGLATESSCDVGRAEVSVVQHAEISRTTRALPGDSSDAISKSSASNADSFETQQSYSGERFMTRLEDKSTTDEIRARFDGDVERFSQLETGQTATIDAPLAMELITRAAVASTAPIRRVLDIGCGGGNNTIKLRQVLGSRSGRFATASDVSARVAPPGWFQTRRIAAQELLLRGVWSCERVILQQVGDAAKRRTGWLRFRPRRGVSGTESDCGRPVLLQLAAMECTLQPPQRTWRIHADRVLRFPGDGESIRRCCSASRGGS